MPAILRAALLPRVKRLRYLGAFFAFTAHQPRALYAFHTWTEELKAAVPDNLTEVVALAIATATNNDYERVQHERLALKQGQSQQWVNAASHGDVDDTLSPTERAVQSLALGMLATHGRDVERELAAAVDALGQETATGVLWLVGRYIAHACMSNALGLTPPFSPGQAE